MRISDWSSDVCSSDLRIGSQSGCNQVIEPLDELGAGERLRDKGGGRETIQLFRRDTKHVRRVDDCLDVPIRQNLGNLTVLPERDCQDDRVDRKGGVQGTRVTGRVDLGGGGVYKKRKREEKRKK